MPMQIPMPMHIDMNVKNNTFITILILHVKHLLLQYSSNFHIVL